MTYHSLSSHAPVPVAMISHFWKRHFALNDAVSESTHDFILIFPSFLFIYITPSTSLRNHMLSTAKEYSDAGSRIIIVFLDILFNGLSADS